MVLRKSTVSKLLLTALILLSFSTVVIRSGKNISVYKSRKSLKGSNIEERELREEHAQIKRIKGLRRELEKTKARDDSRQKSPSISGKLIKKDTGPEGTHEQISVLKREREKERRGEPLTRERKTKENQPQPLTFSSSTYWVEAGTNGNGSRESNPAGNITYVLNNYDLKDSVINVKPGTYSNYNPDNEDFPLNFTGCSNVMLNSTGNSSNTVIGGSGRECGIKVKTDNFTIEGFTIKGFEYCISLQGSNYSKIRNNKIISEEYDSVLLSNSNNSMVSGNKFLKSQIGPGVGIGNSHNNTIKDNDITRCWDGVSMWGSSSGNIIKGNNITNNDRAGIRLDEVKHHNTVKGNNITDNGYFGGIWLDKASHTMVKGNNFTRNHIGVYLWGANIQTHNTIKENNFTSNDIGIYIQWLMDNKIVGNNLKDNRVGIRIFSGANKVKGNKIVNSSLGIKLKAKEGWCTYNKLSWNIMKGCGILLSGEKYFMASQVITSTNTVNGKPVRYYKNENGVEVPKNTGQVILVNSHSSEILNLNLSKATVGIQLLYSNNNTIAGSNISSNSWSGIRLRHARSNEIKGNNITENDRYGVYLLSKSIRNKLYRNNFINNTVDANDTCGGNWFNGTWIGNYWSDYKGKDEDGNKIGDSFHDLPCCGWDFLPSMDMDITPPLLKVHFPTDDGVLTGHLTVNWTGEDEGSGIRRYEIQTDGKKWISVNSTTYTFTDLKDGSHNVIVVAVDGAWNTKSKSVTFTTDSTPPSIEVTTPSSGEKIGTSEITLRWVGEDKLTGVDHYEVFSNGEWKNVGKNPSYKFTSLENGGHTVEVRAVDGVGNKAKASVSFIVDTKDPLVKILFPSPGKTIDASGLTVKWEGNGTGTIICHYEVLINGEGGGNVSRNWYTFTGLRDGSHTVEVKAVDGVGHSTTVSVSFTVNTSPIGGPGMVEEIAIGVGVGIAVVAIVAFYFFKMKK